MTFLIPALALFAPGHAPLYATGTFIVSRLSPFVLGVYI